MAHRTPEEYLELPYTIEVFYDDSDGEPGWVARVVEFPGCITQGDTFEELGEMIREAMLGWIKIELEDGEEIPEPQTLNSFSGQTRIMLPKSLHRDLSHQAKNENVSLNTYIINLLAERNIIKRISRDIEIIKYNQEYALKAGRLTEGSGPATGVRYVQNSYESQQWLGH